MLGLSWHASRSRTLAKAGGNQLCALLSSPFQFQRHPQLSSSYLHRYPHGPTDTPFPHSNSILESAAQPILRVELITRALQTCKNHPADIQMSHDSGDQRSLLRGEDNHRGPSQLPHSFDPIDFDDQRDLGLAPSYGSPLPGQSTYTAPPSNEELWIQPSIALHTSASELWMDDGTSGYPLQNTRHNSPVSPIQGLGIAEPQTHQTLNTRGPTQASGPIRAADTTPWTIPPENHLSPQPPARPFASPVPTTSSAWTPKSSSPFLSPTPSYLYDGEQFGRSLVEDDGAFPRGAQTFTDNLDRAFERMEEPHMTRGFPHSSWEQSPHRGGHNHKDARDAAACPAKHDILRNFGSWVNVFTILVSILALVGSLMWLILAVKQVRYGRLIHSNGSFTPQTASIIFACLAKLIEMCYVSAFGGFLGQILTRNLLLKSSRGVTIAELSMRNWVLQPGFIIAHWEHVFHAGWSFLGGMTLLVTVLSLSYTTASDALVSPHLKFGPWENQVMYGTAKTSYANAEYISNSCPTPITLSQDPQYAGSTCEAIAYSGQSYHDQGAFFQTWESIIGSGVGMSSDLSTRPLPQGMLYDNTTVVGSWVNRNTSNPTLAYAQYNRVINNVTMSMPHAGVFKAARDERNGILQPEELQGLGEYRVRASVVAPSLNVLCVNMNVTELAPLIYTTWPNARMEDVPSSPGRKYASAGWEDEVQTVNGSKYLNATVADDIFGWGAVFDRQPPVFPMFPIDYNSIANISVSDSDSVYLLIKSSATTDFTVCQMRSYLSSSCSTSYNVTGQREGHLSTRCGDSDDQMRYDKFVENPPLTRSTNWKAVGGNWTLSLSLNTGISDADASTTRLLSQLILTVPQSGVPVELDPAKPSLAEYLAVLAGNTLLSSSMDASFYHYWNDNSSVLNGISQPFNASVSSQQYTSGATQTWQKMFYVVLAGVCVTSFIFFVFSIVRKDLVTDYTEPQNLFALAVNSPPSQRLSGSCGAGPEGDQLNVDWHVSQQDDSGHFFIKEGENNSKSSRDVNIEQGMELRRRGTIIKSYTMLSSKRSSFL